MPELASGSRLGPYEILGQIGAGGMGEVYRATDTRLDRLVALKVSKTDFDDRFEREARAVAALSHPHICALYDVGPNYLVMELVDGVPLAGPLPIDQAVEYAAQILDALDAAHKKGITHRDLKPANILVTKHGIKLLDFGLAKQIAGPLGDAQATMSVFTSQGQIVGTLQYMAPEQLQGQPVDARADLFAFGCVFYELLSGTRAFDGTSPASVIAAILERQPLPVTTHPPLDRVIATCLAKHPDERFQTALDTRRAMHWAMEQPRASATTSVPTSRRRERAWMAIAAASLVFAIATLTLWSRSRTPPVTAVGVSRLLLSDQPPASSEALVRSFAISPDGRRVAYAAIGEGVRRIYLRDLQTLEAKPIAGTESGFGPFFSPEGKRLGFWAAGALKVIDIDGGSANTLAEGVWDRGAAWAPDDTIIYSPLADQGLYRVPVTGGTPQLVASPDPAKHERSYRWPHLLPGGDAVLFTIAMSDFVSFDEARIAVRSLKTGEQREVLRGGSLASYVAPGYLLYVRANALQAVRFNAAKAVVEGPPSTVVDGVLTYPTTGSAQYAISSDGTLLYQRGGPDVGPTKVLAWVDRAGRSVPLSVPPAAFEQLSISPDGRFAALSIVGANSSIWILEIGRGTMTRLTLESSNHTPAWTADGARIAFVSARSGGQSLWWQSIDGHAAAEPLTPGRVAWEGVFSPDGRTLAFDGPSPDTGFDVWIMPMDGNRQARPFVQTKFDEDSPRFSPDGRWLAYVSNETGAREVYAQPFPGPGRRVRISTKGGTLPIWSRDGRELYYREGTGLLTVRVSTAAVNLAPQSPELLFRGSTLDRYDVSSDGRFLMMEPVEAKVASAPIAIVLNWLEELKSRVPPN